MFFRKQKAAQRSFAADPVAGGRNSSSGPGGGSTFSIFGPDIAITGDVKASADLHIDGRIEGDIDCQALVQGEGSEIVGAISAQSARLAGVVRGSIDAGSLVILKSARIHGDVSYDALTIEQGAEVAGRFAHRSAVTAAVLPLTHDDDAARISLVN
jgi:cytoskeletal protein CcmA (bactofilin family)